MESATRGRDTLPLISAVAIYTGMGLRMIYDRRCLPGGLHIVKVKML